MWEYTDKVKDHFLKPRNVGIIEDSDGMGEVGSMACGDALKLFFKLDENKKIKDAKFQTFGCAGAIANYLGEEDKKVECEIKPTLKKDGGDIELVVEEVQQ
jgi:NifU-like protein